MLYIERVKALRNDHDFNQTQVAHAIHVAQTTYSDYEKGKVRIPVECLIQLFFFKKKSPPPPKRGGFFFFFFFFSSGP